MPKRLTNDEFLKNAHEIHGEKYKYLDTYINSKIKIKIYCIHHGYFYQTPMTHLEGKGCPLCGKIKFSKKVTYTLDEFITKSKLIHHNKYTYYDYNHSEIPVKILCPKHGIFLQKPRNHLRGKGCPKCKVSKGENTIINFLELHNIKYNYQHKFSDCKYKHKLPFDFYLPEINTVIEFQGIQHYKIVEYWGGKNTLDIVKIRDEIKKNYCINNNIKLIEIKYNEIIGDKLSFLISVSHSS